MEKAKERERRKRERKKERMEGRKKEGKIFFLSFPRTLSKK